MNKMKEILSRSGSAEMMIIYYMLDKGIENLKSITEDDIKTVRGNGLMTEEFCQSIVRTAVRIAKSVILMKFYNTSDVKHGLLLQ